MKFKNYISITFCILSILMFFGVSNKASAQFVGGVMVYPNIIELNFPEGKTFASTVIQVENPTDKAFRVRAYIEDWTLNDYGKIVFLDKPDKYFLGDYVKFNPKEFDLAPKERQTIRIASKMPEGADGEYRSIIYFETINPKQEILQQNKGKVNINVTFKTRYGIPIYAYKGSVSRSAVMQDLKFEKKDNLSYLTATLKNSGNIHCNVSGELTLTPDPVADAIKIPLIRYTILPDSTQKYAIQLPDELLSGNYKALIKLNYTDANDKVQVMDAQTNFGYVAVKSAVKKDLKNKTLSGDENIKKTPDNVARPIELNTEIKLKN